MVNKNNKESNYTQTLLVLGIGFSVLFLMTERMLFIYLVIVLLTAGAISPKIGRFIDFLWMKLGEILGMVIPKIILGIVFYLFLTPVAFLSKVFSKEDSLMLKNRLGSTFKNINKHYIPKYFETPW